MRIIRADVKSGKTNELVEWVKQGNRRDTYPGWDRIIVVPTLQRADLLRGGDPRHNRYGLEYQQVYAATELEWVSRWPIHAALDELEEFVGRPLPLHGLYIALATTSAPILSLTEFAEEQRMRYGLPTR